MADIFNGKVRDRGPETSWDAAAAQTTNRTSALRSTIAAILAAYGDLTDEELVDAFAAYRTSRDWIPNVTPQSVRTRRHEMHVAGEVRHTGRYRATRAGHRAIVWTLTQHGDMSEATA